VEVRRYFVKSLLRPLTLQKIFEHLKRYYM